MVCHGSQWLNYLGLPSRIAKSLQWPRQFNLKLKRDQFHLIVVVGYVSYCVRSVPILNFILHTKIRKYTKLRKTYGDTNDTYLVEKRKGPAALSLHFFIFAALNLHFLALVDTNEFGFFNK